METAAIQVLEILNSLDKKNNQASFEELESRIDHYITFFPQSMTHRNDTIQKFKEIDYHLYGQIVDKIFSIVASYQTIDDSLCIITSKFMVIDYIPFSMFFELIIIVDNHLKKSVNHTKARTMFLIYQQIMKSNALYSTIVDICSNEQTREKYDTIEQRWKMFLQLLISLPYKVTNKIQEKNSAGCFQINTYSKLLTYHISRALIFLNNEHKQQCMELNFSFISLLISKCIIALGSHNFVDLIYILQSWSLNRQKNMKFVIQKILYHLERNSVELIAVLFLKSIKNSFDVSEIFGDIINISQWKHILTTKIPLLSYYASDNIIINLISYLSYFCSKNNLLTNLLMKLLNIWRNKSNLSHISIDQHEYIAKLIIISVEKLKSYSNLIDKNEIKNLLFQGTFLRLNSLNIELRAIGMITSELVVLNFKDSENSPELKFDYNMLSDMGKKRATKIRNFSKNISKQYLQKNNSVSFISVSNDDGDEKVIELGIHCCILSNNTKDSYTFNPFENSLPEETKCEIIKEIGNVDNEQKNEYNEIDSDDDLIPYNISSENKIIGNTKPVYLRDLKDNLINSLANNNSNIFFESLEAAEDLILSQLPNDDSSFAIELLNILLMLKENMNVKNFTTLKLKACVAVVFVHPKNCAKYLCDQFHSESKEITVDDRLMCLKILTEAAKKLSNLEMDRIKPEKSTIEMRKKYMTCFKPEPSFLDMCSNKKNEIFYDDECEVSLVHNNTSDKWKEIIEERIKSNTKFVVQKTKNSKETINEFNNVASYFVYPLIYGMIQNHTFFVKLPNQFTDVKNILLINFLHTLTILMKAVENCVIAPRIALSILELAWSLRYHEEVNIRLTAIKSIAVVIVTLSQNNFTSEILTLLFEFKVWLADVSLDSVTGDPDINCRNLGKSVIFLIDSIIKSSIESF